MEVLTTYKQWGATLPDEMTSTIVLISVESVAPVQSNLHE